MQEIQIKDRNLSAVSEYVLYLMTFEDSAASLQATSNLTLLC